MKPSPFGRIAFTTLALAALLLASCSREPPPNPAVAEAVARFDVKQKSVEEAAQRVRAENPENDPDFRGRTQAQDLEQWALPAQSRERIATLRAKALSQKYPADAEQFLATAETELQAEILRMNAITKYWTGTLPAPFWRRYWQALFESNGMPADAPDPMLVGIENRVRKSLDAGDFTAAAAQSEELVDVLAESQERAISRILKARKLSPNYQPRKSACVRGLPAAGLNERAKFVRGESIDKFYPAAAIRKGESGVVVLSARVESSGCASSVAVVVHSGVPALDAAALEWFETARFSPATRSGAPITSEFMWKVRFVLSQ